MEEEQWRPVPDFPGYCVSDRGRVLSLERYVPWNGFLKFIPRRELRQAGSGYRLRYKYVQLYRGKTQVKRYVAHLVAEAFIGPRPEGKEVCHNDGDAANNWASNLRYDTHSENLFDAVRHGTHQWARKTRCRYGHLLSAPNLVPTARARCRDCLACNRARARITYSKKHGRPHDELQVEGDRYYRAILEKAAQVPVSA
jgi:hypothetical protein